ncbi:AMP-binding protein [Noviherbaspirillum sp. CPCC 100848]|uniref:AMP-binding protein n=1 Tax=Noviherbaspirillum album TaxID=3080276 RepID=A0ABU6JJ35_9BURK|nr:AMP-binding protein [Noviherbaspirillum sp. CPCC 100848]MEC4723697.1 AMP-binding protein [Noviherbaspirillum sp. CPCC 100848]
MIRFPALQDLKQGQNPFTATTFDDWVATPSVYALLQESARMHGDRTALIWINDGEPEEKPRQVSYAALLEEVSRTANLFRALGVQRKDVIAYMLPSFVETQYVLWGAETAGIACPINFLLQPEHIAELLRAAGAKALVACGRLPGIDIWEKALQVRSLVPGLVLIRVNGQKTDDSDVVDFESARRAQPADLSFFDLPSRGDVAAYFHTGGTTGLPKLVTHSHQNQLSAAYGAAVAANLCPSDVITNGFPMFHVAGTIFCSLSQLMAGAGILILSAGGFRNPAMIRNFWRIVERYRVTIAGAVPTALSAIVGQEPGGADISSLRVVMSGASSLPRSVAESAERITGRQVREMLGMTETGGVIATEAAWHDRVLGSAGHPIPFVDIEARRMEMDGSLGRRCEAEEIGVLVVRGPNVTDGYKNPAHNAGAFTNDGWLVSGDLGYLDLTGRVFLTGRAKDLIIRSGHNIDPAMIEDAFLAHPSVTAAAAVGMPDAYAGELPVAFVVLKPGHHCSDTDLQAFVEKRIHERPAYPKRIFLVDSLPMTGVGKIFKPALRSQCAAALFGEVLDGEPVRSLIVSEKSKRGMLLEIGLDADASDNADQRELAQQRIAKKLAPYLVSIAWSN